MMRFEKVVGFAIAITLSGCAMASGPQWTPDAAAVPIAERTHEALSPEAELMYQILAAEMAGKRGHTGLALEYYLAAAQASNDPRVAERAVGIALFVDDAPALLAAARRWHGLQPDNAQARQALVLGLLRNGQIDEAIAEAESLRKATAEDGQDGFATVRALLGQVDDKAAAFRLMKALSERHPQSRYALYHYALAALEVDELGQALEGVDRALAQDPKWSASHLLRARVLMKQGDMEAALAGLEAAVAALPEDVTLRMGYARLLAGVDRLDDAREQFELLAKQKPGDVEPLFALGVLSAQAGEYDKAVSYYTEVLQRGGRAADVYFELGKIEELRGNYSKARDWYARINSGDNYLNAQVRLGAMLGRLQDFQGLAGHFAQLRRDHPQREVPLYLAQADILRREQHYPEAFALLNEALEQYSDDEELLYARALAAEKVDRLDILEQDLLALIQANPDHGQALNALGYTLADRTERYEEALGYLQRAIALLPDDAAVLDSMGWIKYRLGDYEESLSYLRRAYGLSNDAEIAAHLSEVLWVSGHRDEAREIWRSAMEKNPGNSYLSAVQKRFGL